MPKALRKLGIDAAFQGFWGGSKTRGGFIGGGESWGDEHILEIKWKTLACSNLLFEKPFTIRIDNAYLLRYGTLADIEKAVKNCIEIDAPGSGYCPGSSGNINPGAPLANTITLYKAIKKYGKYPKIRRSQR